MSQSERTRRSPGEGTIYFNDDRERWEGQIQLGRDVAGVRVRRKVTGRTRREVADRLAELRSDFDRGLDRARRPTVAELTDEWLAKSAARTKAASTLSRVRRRLEQHLVPALGTFRIDELRPEDVERWLAAEVAAGAALRTVQDYRGDLRQVLGWAERRRLLDWNVATIAELPAGARPPAERRSLTEDQAEQLLGALDNDRLGPYWTTLLLLGLRPGEADALTWDTVADGHAVIDRALQRDETGRPIAVGPTKTKQTRVLAIPEPVVAALRVQRVRQAAERLAAGPGWSKRWDGHVFLNELGRPFNPSNVRRAFAATCRHAGLPVFTPYELRHSTASLLIAAGVPPFEVADLLGHADLRMLERHYRHRLNPVVDAAHHLTTLADRARAAHME